MNNRAIEVMMSKGSSLLRALSCAATSAKVTPEGNRNVLVTRTGAVGMIPLIGGSSFSRVVRCVEATISFPSFVRSLTIC
jgi:hypothetical protein